MVSLYRIPPMLLLALVLFLWSCKSNSPNSDAVQIADPLETYRIGSVDEEPDDLMAYQASPTRKWDLLHTQLEVGFNWEDQTMSGVARLDLTPVFYAMDTIWLDARGFEINSIKILSSDAHIPPRFAYDSIRIELYLPEKYLRGDTLQLEINYLAQPATLEERGLEEGAGQGLYFINHDGSDSDKPQQIWTQGETQANSCWFPTIDRPNERCTQEMFITVEDRFKTLSNGVLMDSEALDKGMRRDHWVMRQPHAPYLFMMAIGEFAVVKDEWRGREVSYYVEPEYEKYARLVFGKTPAMLEYFSNLLGVEYAWDKYAQVVVRDFVSGAMENTSATIHMGGLQHDDREHLDESYEEYVSHELFHQWFGDLVTCESWANLTMNEAFATYGEFLWIEHDQDAAAAASHFLSDRRGYLREAKYAPHPLIHFRHEDREDMFDGHSYAKGGQVLHMLRNLVGDEAFFASLRYYLKRHAFTDVESHELRLAFEDVTGRDLNWFFDQWFFSTGHPQLSVTHKEGDGGYQLFIEQTQETPFLEVFQFPLKIHARCAGELVVREVWIQSRDTVVDLNLPESPEYVVVNADGVLLTEIEEKGKEYDAWTAQALHESDFFPQLAAVEGLKEHLDQIETWTTFQQMLPKVSPGIAVGILGRTRSSPEPGAAELGRAVVPLLASSDAHLRAEALAYFIFFDAEKRATWNWTQDEWNGLASMAKKCIDDKSYRVERNGIRVYYRLENEEGLKIALERLQTCADVQKGAYCEILARANHESAIPKALDLIHSGEWSMVNGGLTALSILVYENDSQAGLDAMKNEAINQEEWWMRSRIARIMGRFDRTDDLTQFFQERAEQEEHPRVKSVWEGLVKK